MDAVSRDASSWRVTIRVNDYDLAREVVGRLRDVPFRVLKFEALTADGEPVIYDFEGAAVFSDHDAA